jgi:hypothetical protein
MIASRAVRDSDDHYLERSFLPGRTFTGPEDFNAQLQQWLSVVNARTRRALGLRADRSDRRRPARHAHVAAGCAGDRVGSRCGYRAITTSV